MARQLAERRRRPPRPEVRQLPDSRSRSARSRLREVSLQRTPRTAGSSQPSCLRCSEHTKNQLQKLGAEAPYSWGNRVAWDAAEQQSCLTRPEKIRGKMAPRGAAPKIAPRSTETTRTSDAAGCQAPAVDLESTTAEVETMAPRTFGRLCSTLWWKLLCLAGENGPPGELERLTIALLKLRRRCGHPGRQAFLNILKSRGSDARTLAVASQLKCPECQESQPRVRRRGRSSLAYCSDGRFLLPARGNVRRFILFMVRLPPLQLSPRSSFTTPRRAPTEGAINALEQAW